MSEVSVVTVEENKEKEDTINNKKDDVGSGGSNDVPNLNPTLKVSKSFYEKISDLLGKSPATIITSVCALFIVLILSIILPLYFPPNK